MTRAISVGWSACLAVLTAVAWAPTAARADIANFEFDGKIYNKFMYSNDGTQGCLWLGNPAWVDNITGANGACSEFELGIRANVSKYVRAGVRIKSRWGATWQDWWENGDMKMEDGSPVNFPGDTSGESIGMNHAQYIRLRGFWIEVAPPIKTVEKVRVGASDLGMFNPWTIGKVRYIDRDNGRGTFVLGSFERMPLKYEAAIIALPKLVVGPSWNLGNDDPTLKNPFISEDYAYAMKLSSRPLDDLDITGIMTYTRDVEFNLDDPDAQGSTNPDGQKDGGIDRVPRYRSANGTLEANYYAFDVLHINALGAYFWQSLNPDYTFNGAESAQGFTPVVYTGDPLSSYAAKLRADLTDPLDIGLSLNMEYFNIGENYNAIFGSRREADVLLTDGFIEGGQLPTLNLANEFQDWDEPWFETVIGWRGLTVVATQMLDVAQIRVEFTQLGYNTDAQGRNVDHMYPGFLYPDGYTDTDFYDYANTTDRGRDFRSVYRENQDRSTQIVALWYDTYLDIGKGGDVNAKLKYIRDRDTRGVDIENDDYAGDIMSARLKLSYNFSNEIQGFIGDEWNHWRELNRSTLVAGNLNSGYWDYVTRKNKVFAGLEYNFAGVKLKYLAEWVIKDQDRYNLEPLATNFDALALDAGDLIPRLNDASAYQVWNRMRAKASLEAAW